MPGNGKNGFAPLQSPPLSKSSLCLVISEKCFLYPCDNLAIVTKKVHHFELDRQHKNLPNMKGEVTFYVCFDENTLSKKWHSNDCKPILSVHQTINAHKSQLYVFEIFGRL